MIPEGGGREGDTGRGPRTELVARANPTGVESCAANEEGATCT